MIGRIILGAVAMASTAAVAAEPRQPTSKWVVNFADAQCIATRNYGTDADPLYLVLKSPAIGDSLQLGTVRKGGKIDARQLEGEVVLDDSRTVPASFLEFGSKSLDQRTRLTILDASGVASLGQSKTVGIRIREKGIDRLGTRLGMGLATGDDAFAVTQMPQLLGTLRTCSADLRKVWKVWDDKTGGDGLREGPSADLARLFDPEDYPGFASLRGQTGIVSLVLLVDEQGKVADCTVIQTSGVAALDGQSCAIIKLGAKFKPAVGVDGKPAKSAAIRRVGWRLQ